MFSDLSSYSRFASLAKQLKKDVSHWRKETFKEWCQDTMRAIDDPSQALKYTSSFKLNTYS